MRVYATLFAMALGSRSEVFGLHEVGSAFIEGVEDGLETLAFFSRGSGRKRKT